MGRAVAAVYAARAAAAAVFACGPPAAAFLYGAGVCDMPVWLY